MGDYSLKGSPNGSLTVLGTGISFQNPEHAKEVGYEGCDMQTELLPSMLRRRTSAATKMAFSAAERACSHAGLSPSDLPVIFTSSLGEAMVTDKLCSDIANRRFPVSPTQFHNSVHNTASGYWSIAVGNKHPAMAMAAYQDSFALGLLEAWSQLHTVEKSVLLVCYEEMPPELMLPDHNWVGCAIAFVLSSEPAMDGRASTVNMPFCEQADREEQSFGKSSPALAALPLLKAVEQGSAGRVRISPDGENRWFVDVMS